MEPATGLAAACVPREVKPAYGRSFSGLVMRPKSTPQSRPASVSFSRMSSSTWVHSSSAWRWAFMVVMVILNLTNWLPSLEDQCQQAK
jgi:hypothetical protein